MGAYLKAFLVRLCEGLPTTSALRRFLLKHPLLILDLGFHLVLDPDVAYGFDSEETLPCNYWLRQQLRSPVTTGCASNCAALMLRSYTISWLPPCGISKKRFPGSVRS